MTNAEMTNQTKHEIAETFKKLICKKPLSKITVSEIARECNINRKTFYYHFEDIYALLKWILEEEAIHVVQSFNLLVDYKAAIVFVVDYVTKNDYLLRCVYDSVGINEMKRFFCTDFYDVVRSVFDRAEEQKGSRLDPEFKSFLVRFYTEALAGILMEIVQETSDEKHRQTMGYAVKAIQTQINHLVNTLESESSDT